MLQIFFEGVVVRLFLLQIFVILLKTPSYCHLPIFGYRQSGAVTSIPKSDVSQWISGYVQAMSDYLSPLLFVMQNEVDAFWAFVGLMDRIVGPLLFFLFNFGFLSSNRQNNNYDYGICWGNCAKSGFKVL